MGISLREQLLQRVLSVLQGAATGAASISRSREISITRTQSPAIVIMPAATDTRDMDDKADRHAHEFAVEIFVRGDPWDSLADPVDVLAHAALAADALSTNAGALGTFLARLDRVGEAFDGQEADRTAGTLTVRYRATYLASKRAIDRSWP